MTCNDQMMYSTNMTLWTNHASSSKVGGYFEGSGTLPLMTAVEIMQVR